MTSDQIREYAMKRIEDNLAQMKTAKTFLELSDFSSKMYESVCFSSDIDAITFSEHIAYLDRHYDITREMIKAVFAHESKTSEVTP